MTRIAIITYDISPYRGSEASVSWNFVQMMHHHVSLTVIYGRGHSDMQRYLADSPMADVNWVHVPTPELFGSDIVTSIRYNLHYRRWHKQVADTLRMMVAEGKIDIIHYLNPIGFKEPGFAWKIKEVPYVWGPVKGAENKPISLFRVLAFKWKLEAIARRIIHNAMFHHMPRVRKAFKRADAIFAATPKTVTDLETIHHRHSTYLPENGILAMERTSPISLNESEPLQIIFAGEINDSKGLRIILDALRKTTTDRWHLDVVGDGPSRERLQRRYADLAARITWHGRIPRSDVQTVFMQAHIHIISSLSEATTTVIWEAMAKAVPTMTLDHCGMAGVVCDRCGIKIPINGYDNVTDRIASEIDSFISNPHRIKSLSEGVIECSRKFMWNQRVPILLDTYRQLLQNAK